MAIPATQMRPGMIIKHNNELHTVFSVEHRTPGNLRAFIQAKLRNLRTGAMFEHRFRSPDPIERVIVDEISMDFLYADGDDYYFMNTENYEQTHLKGSTLGDAIEYLTPNLQIKVSFFDGVAVGIELPQTVEMTVVETEPGTEVRHCLFRHQARQNGNRPRRPGAALHQRRGKDSRRYRRRRIHVSSIRGKEHTYGAPLHRQGSCARRRLPLVCSPRGRRSGVEGLGSQHRRLGKSKSWSRAARKSWTNFVPSSNAALAAAVSTPCTNATWMKPWRKTWNHSRSKEPGSLE